MAFYNMRSFVLALGIAGAAGACDVGSTPVTADPDAPIVNGADAPISATPKVAVAVDKTAINTELLTQAPIMVTATGSGGFSGAVNLTATVVDGTGAAIPNVTAVFNTPTVTLTANGTATAALTVTLPNKVPASATVKVSATSSAGTQDVTSTLTVAQQVTLKITNDGGGGCKYPATVEVRAGTKVRFMLTQAVGAGILIHSGGPIPHQNTAATPMTVGQSYDVTPNTVGGAQWWCHSPGPDFNMDMDLNTNNPVVNVVAP